MKGLTAGPACTAGTGTRHGWRGLTSNGLGAACQEDTRMIARKALFPSARATALGVATALALTAIAPTVTLAASPGKGLTATTGGMTDISARRRGFNPGAAAGAAAVAGVVGFGIA